MVVSSWWLVVDGRRAPNSYRDRRLDARSALALLDIGQLTDGGEVVGGGLEDVVELRSGFVIPAHFEQGAAERDSR
jgi:hypothetical protein